MRRWALAAIALLTLCQPLLAGDALQRALDDLRAGNPRAIKEVTRQGAKAVPGLTKLLAEEDAKVRGLAALSLGMIGPAAKEAAPTLAAALADRDVSVASQAARSLARIGPEAAPSIAQVLKKEGRPEVAVRACEALRFLGPAGKESVPALVLAFKKPGQPENLLPLVEALGRIGPDAHPAVEDLALALAPDFLKGAKNPEALRDGLRVHVVQALGRIGPQAKKAVPGLLTLLKEKRLPGDPLCQMVLETLADIGSPTEELVPILIDQIGKGTGPRLLLFRTLAQTGSPGKEHLPTLAAGMRDKNPWIRLYAAALVGKLEPNNPAVVSVLIESLQEPDAALRKQAADYAGAIGPRDESVREAVALATKDKDPLVRKAAAEALKNWKK